MDLFSTFSLFKIYFSSFWLIIKHVSIRLDLSHSHKTRKIFIALATTGLIIASNAQVSAGEAEITINGEASEEASLINQEANSTTTGSEEFLVEEAVIIPPTTTEEIFYPAEEVTMSREEGELSDNDNGDGDDDGDDGGVGVSPGFLGEKILVTSAGAFFAAMTLMMM